MFRYMSTIALFLWATSSNAVIQNSDFWFHDEGDTIFINGARGAPLHIDYIGAPLTKPLKVRVTPNNPKLKIAAPICTFTKKDDDCWLTVRLENGKQKVYGVNHFTVTEVGASKGVLNGQAAADTGIVGFGVGVQGKDMPKPIPWATLNTDGDTPTNKVIITNATNQLRLYEGDVYAQSLSYTGTLKDYDLKTKKLALPSRQSCYLDYYAAPSASLPYLYYYMSSNAKSLKFSDVTIESDPIFNGAYQTGDSNITTCFAMGLNRCASDKWSSWSIGLANIGANDLKGGVKAGQVETLRDSSWRSNTGSDNSWIYFEGMWYDKNLAVLLIQGSTDGSPFDAGAAAPSLLEIKSAPPCSDYIKGDPSVTYTVRLEISGPGSVTVPAGTQCQAYSYNDVSFTRCTGSGLKDTIYEITAVPEPGKTFKGWGSDGLCDDTKTSCRFQLTKEVSMRPFFW
jgi:hypothetical protein